MAVSNIQALSPHGPAHAVDVTGIDLEFHYYLILNQQ